MRKTLLLITVSFAACGAPVVDRDIVVRDRVFVDDDAVDDAVDDTVDEDDARDDDVVVGGAFLSGRICNRHVGAFVVGAGVVVDGSAAVGVTDEDGAFVVEVAPGLRVVTIAGEGFQKSFAVEAIAGADVSVHVDAVCTAD